MKNRTIKIAILSEEHLGWGSGKHYFLAILNNYRWKTKNKKFKFVTEYINDKQILNGHLNTSRYDLLIVPGGGVGDGEAIIRGFPFFLSNRRWKKQIKNFIKSGGGYVGICGGTACFTGLDCGKDKKPLSFIERLYNRSNVEVSSVKHFYRNLGFPLFYLFQKSKPENIGATAYVFSFAPGKTKDGRYIHTGGVPVDFKISKDNPIFKDYPKDEIKIRWWGGPALTISKDSKRKIKVLSYYPENDFSKDPKTGINAWVYTGGITGLISAFFKSLSFIKKKKLSIKDVFMYTYFFAKPWEKTKKNVKLHYSSKPSMTAEIYPNKNKGRIVLCTSHPEYMIWKNGFIEEMPESNKRCIANGFHRWRDIKPTSNNFVEELTYTWWIVRRIVAWSAKVKDSDMPPIEKGILNKDTKKIIEKNILWDGSILDQIKNI